MRVENMTDREIVAACAVDFRRKAQEAYDAYQSTGMKRYDNAYHKYEALADALDRDVQKADTRQAAASLKSELIMLASCFLSWLHFIELSICFEVCRRVVRRP